MQKFGMMILIVATLFLTGCSSPKTTDEEIYAVAWVLHNVDDSTPLLYEVKTEDYGAYRFKQELPGNSPEYYASILWFISPLQGIAVSSHVYAAAPLVQTIYGYVNNPSSENYCERIGEKCYGRDFSLDRSVFLNYLRAEDPNEQFGYDVSQEELISGSPVYSIVPKSGEVKEFSFGGNYLPGSILVEKWGTNDGTIRLRKYILGGENSFVRKDTNISVCGEECKNYMLEKPYYEIFKDGEKVYEGNLTDYYERWDGNALYYHFEESSNYLANLNIPAYYPIFNRTIVTAEFSTYGDDWNPPWLENIKISPRFSEGVPLEISINASDDVNVSSVKAYSRNETSEWEEVSLTTNWEKENESLAFGEIVPYGQKIDLKIVLEDNSSNKQTYVIEPVSLAKKELEIELKKDKEILSPGTKVRLYGRITDSAQGVSNLLIREIYNKNELGKTYTSTPYSYIEKNISHYIEGGNFSFYFDIPLDYNEESNLSLVFGGTGIYPSEEYVISGSPLLEKDAAVFNIYTTTPIYSGNNSINVSVANVGLTPIEEATLNLYWIESDYDGREFGMRNIIDSKMISLDVGEMKNVSFEGWLTGRGYIKIIAALSAADDLNSGNNERDVVKSIFSDIDASVDISIEPDEFGNREFIVNESRDVRLTISNLGLNSLNDINYSFAYKVLESGRDLEEQEVILVESGTIEYLGRGRSTTKTISLVFNEPKEILLIGTVNVSDDKIENNNIYQYFSRVAPVGSELFAYVDAPRSIIVNESFNATAFVYNRGNRKSEDGLISLYYQEGDCGWLSECDNLTLIESRSLELNPFESKEEKFDFSYGNVGFLTLVAYANATNDVGENKKQDHRIVEIKDNGPDVAVRLDFGEGFSWYATRNEPKNIPLIVENVGNEKAEDVMVNVYKESKATNGVKGEMVRELIGSEIIGEIEAREDRSINITIMPDAKGELYLYINISAKKDVYYDNNYWWVWLDVLNNRKDIAIEAWMPIFIINIFDDIYWGVYNVGNESVPMFNVSFYKDDNLIESQNLFDLAVLGRFWGSFGFTPDSLGNITIRIMADTEGDIDLSDNVVEVVTEVFGLKNVTFNISNYEGNLISDYLFIVDWELSILDGSPKTIEVIDMPSHDIVIANFGKDYENEIGRAQIFETLDLSDTESIISESYDKITQDGKDYYYVFANNVSYSYKSTMLYASINESVSNKLGLDFNRIQDYAIFLCKDFDFAAQQCSGEWNESWNKLYAFRDKYMLISESEEKVSAFSLSNSSGFNGATNLYSFSGDIANNLILEKIPFGRISFLSSVNIARMRGDYSLLRESVKIEQGKISVNTTSLYELENAPANIMLNNINMRNPVVVRDNAPCLVNICSNVNYNSAEQEFTFDISKFSDYEVVEGPYCGDGSCQTSIGESCSGCVADCGSCSAAASEKARRGGGSGGYCFPNWTCYWGVCKNNVKTYTCRDESGCGIPWRRPADAGKTQACFAEANCTDRDGDSYGIGPGCLGSDINDNDPGVTTKMPEPITPVSGRAVSGEVLNTILWAAIAIGAVAVIIVSVLMIRYTKKRKEMEKIGRVKEFIMRAYERGYNDAQIREMFRQKGWSDEDIDKALAS